MEPEKFDTTSLDSQKPEEMDEGCENVPPTSLFDETPPNVNAKGKTRLSGLQSALTPILKYLNIGNINASSISKNDSSPQPNSVPVLPVGDDKGSCTWSVLNENLPEITLLDVTCNSTMNMTNTQLNSEPSTPLSSQELHNPLKILDANLNSKLCPPISDFYRLSDEILPEVTLLDDSCDNTINLTGPDHSSVHLNGGTPFCKTGKSENSIGNYVLDSKKNLTLTPEKSSLTAEMEIPSLHISHDNTAQNGLLESSEVVSAKTSKLEISQSSLDKTATTINCNLTHSISSSSEVLDSKAEDTQDFKLQVTQDILLSCTFDGSKSSSEDATQTIGNTDSVPEVQAINVTRDLSACNESVRREMSHSSGYNSNNVSCELEGEPVKTSGEMPSCISESATMDKQGTWTSEKPQH